MNPIPANVVEKTLNEMMEMSHQGAPKMIKRMTKPQPFILAYLLAVGHDIFNQEEQELFVFLGVVIWRIMSQGDTPLPKVTEEIIDEAEDANFKMLEYLEGESEADFNETTENMLTNYNQQEVLRYVLEAIMEEPEDDFEIREDNKGMMMIYLKTVIDCLDR